MALIDEVAHVCEELAPHGWRELLLLVTSGRLDIRQPNASALRAALLANAGPVLRSHPGFEDYAAEGEQGISPNSPARSLLYHALASPGVQTGAGGKALGRFATRAQIETVENFVFGADPPTVEALLERAHAKSLAVVVFAYEYRPAKDTCAGVQADLAFSRTGVARIGTAPALFDGSRRGYWPEVADNPHAVRVCPAQYGAFLAVARKGSANDALPLRAQPGDAQRTFWVPIHKLFDGDECIAGRNLSVRYAAAHVNDKIRRVHLIALKERAPPKSYPFQFSDGIAEISFAPADGAGCLVPTVHPALVQPAVAEGRPVTFSVPKDNQTEFAAFERTARKDRFGEIRSAPAYVHARTRVADGKTFDMNADDTHPDVRAAVQRGGYEALHYVDFTGEGQVSVHCEGLGGVKGITATAHPAYSLVAAPDFFPATGQRELSEWTKSGEVPKDLAAEIWGVAPEPLCDVRLPANLQIPGVSFDPAETTMTTLVALVGSRGPGGVQPVSRDVDRHSCLPDDAAGTFAPGWDVSHDVVRAGGKSVPHLAAYGLGSPFPEDAKLCAALSTFWPAVAPDAFRSMEPHTGNALLLATVAPLTDEEIGQSGDLPWDGISGPRVVTIAGQDFAECASFLHTDYVDSAVRGKFVIRQTARIDAAEYQQRVLAMAVAYRALAPESPPPLLPGQGIVEVRTRWYLLSFTVVSAGNPEVQEAQAMTGTALSRFVFRCDLFRRPSAATIRAKQGDHRRKLLPISSRRVLLVDVADGRQTVLRRRHGETTWVRLDASV